MAATAKENCQSRILSAAERAFADGGYTGASMRKIVAEAGANLATVYYYFGSKRGLMDAVLKRRFDPLRREHLDLLEQFQNEAQGRPVPVEKILEAMLLPPLRLMAGSVSKRQPVTRLLGRIVTEPDVQTQKILRVQRAELRSAVLQALQRSIPEASAADLQWRLEFIWGALGFILCNPSSIADATGGACNAVDAPTVLREMVDFFSAGFRAMATRQKAPVRKRLTAVRTNP